MTVMNLPQSGPSETSPSEPIALKGLNKKKAHDEILVWVNKQYDAMRNDRTQFQYQWELNLSFYFGNQNVVAKTVPTPMGTSRRLWVPPAPYWRARPIINKIRPLIRTELSKTTSQKPNASVIPASSDDADIFAAQAGEQIWDSIYRRKKVRALLRRAMFWTLTCGNGFIKDWWDERAVDPDSGQYGDICISQETPFNIFVPDLMSEDIEDEPYVIHASTKTVDWVQMNYSKDLAGREVKPNVKVANDIIDAHILKFTSQQSAQPDKVLCLEMWIKPGAIGKFPNGGVLTILGDQVVDGTEGWPYIHKEYPFIKLDHISTGKFYTDSIITDLIGPQREFNRTRGQIIEAKNRMAKPQLVAQQGSINPAQMTTEPGQVVFYKAGMQPPQPLPLQPLPGYVTDELNRIQMDFDDISGQHEVSKGRVPPGVTAATAISYLQEQDDSKLAGTIDSIEEGMEKLGHQVLSFAVQYWDTPRMIKVTGTDGSFDAMMLKSSDLRGNTDINIEAGSALPTSKAAKQALIMDLMKMGFIDPSDGLEVMEMGGIAKLYESVKLDVRQAQRENLRMQRIGPEELMMQQQQTPQVDPATGEPILPPPIVPVNTWDEHEVHISVHDRFRKSQSFELLPDPIRSIFEEHVKQHVISMGMQYQAGAQAEQQQNMQITAGGGQPPQVSAEAQSAQPQGG